MTIYVATRCDDTFAIFTTIASALAAVSSDEEWDFIYEEVADGDRFVRNGSPWIHHCWDCQRKWVRAGTWMMKCEACSEKYSQEHPEEAERAYARTH